MFFVIRTPISPPHPRQAHGTSPLHAAAHWGDVEVVRSLLARGADVDAVDEQGQTPLHVALHHEEVAGELLARGAALHIVRVRTHSQSLTLPHTPSHSLTMMVPAPARVSTACHYPAQLVFFHTSRMPFPQRDWRGRTAEQLAIDKGAGPAYVRIRSEVRRMPLLST